MKISGDSCHLAIQELAATYPPEGPQVPAVAVPLGVASCQGRPSAALKWSLFSRYFLVVFLVGR